MKLRDPLFFLVATLALCLVAFPPFIATLELHHQLGDADNDGHQHSAADLCSWVQSHASSSVTACAVILVSQPAAPEPQAAIKIALFSMSSRQISPAGPRVLSCKSR